MIITNDYLTINQFSRCGRKLASVAAIIYHWVANPGTTAQQNRDFFELRKDGKHGYGSAHFIIDNNGSVIRCIPEDEEAYHVGSSQPDPASGTIYTDWARKKFGNYAVDYKVTSPNRVTIGIELCHLDWNGNFSLACIESARLIGKQLCEQFKLDPLQDIGTHNMVVGWKDCPRLWTQKQRLFEEFKKSLVAS